MTDRLDEPLTAVLGARTAGPLAAMGLTTVSDLLRHYPRRYGDPGTPTDLAHLAVGEHVTVVAHVARATVRQMRARAGAILTAVVTDGAAELSLTFFARRPGALRHHESRLLPGRLGLFTGVVGEYRGERQLTHPDYQVIGVDATDTDAALLEASKPIPIYPASAATPSWRIQACVRTVLDPLAPTDVPDPLPATVRRAQRLPGLLDALRAVHHPTTPDDWHRGRRRLRFEEAFILQTALAKRRAEVQAQSATARPPCRGRLADRFDAALPFTLTEGQRAVGEQLSADLAADRPMLRLLQGDVGSGKTVVALRAMLQVVDAGGQAALLAPTEVLAAQHARTLRALLGPLGQAGQLGGDPDATRIALLTGSLSAGATREALAEAAGGAAGIVVGTHALLSDRVQFADLGLIVVDEQHRFGVEQRDVLRAKSEHSPHLLVMTATPIPRTVAMTVFGDLETSVLTDVPAGRSGITTHVVPAANEAWLDRTWARVREEVDAGRRAYVVCARVNAQESASDDERSADLVSDDAAARVPLRAVSEVAEELRAGAHLSGIEIGILHGQMPAVDKERAMSRFASGEAPVLVATTVVEVGVDVPEATVMVIMDADRFGISQLHQLRGRVGRGSAPGLCLLVSDAAPGTPAAVRVETLARTSDGFELAHVDLELRREGDVLGAAQSGRASSLRLLRVLHDADLIADARRLAVDMIEADPELDSHPHMLAAITDLVDAEREQYLDRA